MTVGNQTTGLWKVENTAISPALITKNTYARFKIRITNRLQPTPIYTLDLDHLDAACTPEKVKADGACYFLISDFVEISLPAQTVSKKMVLLVDGSSGDVKITGNISMSGGGLLVVLAKNNITLAGTVSTLQGIYLADQIFDTGRSSDTTLTVTGTVVGLGGVRLNRDVPSSTVPAERFVFSPEYLAILPAGLYEKHTLWQEQVP